jgi:hypothetical protein
MPFALECLLSWNAFCLGMLFVLEYFLSWNTFCLGGSHVPVAPNAELQARPKAEAKRKL